MRMMTAFQAYQRWAFLPARSHVTTSITTNCNRSDNNFRLFSSHLRVHSKSITHSNRRTLKCFSVAAPSSQSTTPPFNNATSGYRSPPQPILDIVDAPPEPLYSFAPNRKLVLELSRPPANPPIAEFARPELKLAGVRIDPEGFCRSRQSYYTGIKVAAFTDDLHLPFSSTTTATASAPPTNVVAFTGIPEGFGIGDVSWSSDSTHIAFTIRRAGDNWDEDRPPAQLWVADVATGRARPLLPHHRINSIFEDYTWLDDDTIIASVIPEGRDTAPPPTKPVAPSPRIESNEDGKKSQTRTYQDLLKDEHDVALFEYYCEAQLIRVSISTGERSILGDGTPRIYTAIAPSPDSNYILAAWLESPWSFAVPCGRFPKRVELWDRHGAVVRPVAALPLADDIPLAFDSCRKGPRSLSWRDDKPSEFVWVEAQDGGDPAVEASPRDVVYALDAGAGPLAPPRVLAGTDMRFGGITWGHGELALLYESEWKTRRSRTWIVSPDGMGDGGKELLYDRNYEDVYSDPGSPLMRRTSLGRYVLAEIEGPRKLLLQGAGASSEGSRPFLDILDLDSKETTRIWRSSPPYYEFISSIISDAGDDGQPLQFETLKMLGRRESVEEPPQYSIVSFSSSSSAAASSASAPADDTNAATIGIQWRQISSFPHPYPSLKGLTKQVLRYKRDDGVDLNGTLYLPPGYDKDRDGPLPCLLWAYPREYRSKDAAGQLRRSPCTFDSIGSTSPLLFLTTGYAILDGPSMPIIGEGEGVEPNDTYVEQLTSSARAAVEELGRQGTVNVDRVAVAGHSYGAFMAAGLLAHAPELFACGIARSGAYNRTLTPFGFQSEERTLWDAPDTYAKMSPFMNADKIKKPILLIHGEADNNPGTLTLQSERLYSALKGYGAVTRLVVLPYESHSYIARESILHCLAETYDWLERHCVAVAVE